MKIAQVTCTYPPYAGGIGRVAFEYTERLCARGHHVHVFTPRYAEVTGDPEYVHRIPSPLHVGNAGITPSLFYRLKGFDLVHLHYPFFGGAEPVIVRKAIQEHQGLVMTYHHDVSVTGIRGVINHAHRRLLFPWLMNRADRILVSSKEYAESSALADVSGIFDRVEVHPFGVDLERFHPGKEETIRVRWGIPLNAPVFLFVGGMDSAHHFKGLPVLWEALGKLLTQDWHVLLVGDGNLRPEYEEMAQGQSYADRIHFTGNVSDEDLPRYYRAADIHVFPSTKRAEAFGMVVLEAAASGLPTIASDLPGVRGVVLNGETGLLENPGDVEALVCALSLLLEQPALRLRLGCSARTRAEQTFAWDPLITTLEQTYRSVIQQQTKRIYSV